MVGWEIPPPSASKTDEELRREREAKVADLEDQGLLRSERLRRAILQVRREDFVPPAWRDHAYQEVPLPLTGRRSSISCPHSYPLFYESLGLDEGHRFLEIGLGSGYGAALAREVVGPDGLVVSMEIDPRTLGQASATLDRLGYADVVRVLGDGGLGYPPLAPYDRICMTAACDEIPPPLLEQLETGGRLIAPVRHDSRQVLTLIEKAPDGRRESAICDVLYVDLQGFFGVEPVEVPEVPSIVVTCRSLAGGRRARPALRRALPDASVRRTPFRGVLAVYSSEDPEAIAERASRTCGDVVARVTAVFEQVPSISGPLVEAATRVALEHVRGGSSIATRVHKRGSHGYLAATPELERIVGTAVWEALHRRDGEPPPVDLDDPEVTINVEVFGPWSSVGIVRRSWRDAPAPDNGGSAQPAVRDGPRAT
jgi:protein-L-isoaspartate(D-aspartate) O-methyltransferase